MIADPAAAVAHRARVGARLVSATAWATTPRRMQGRLTLNPIAHIDPVGTLLLPLLGIPFGWAKPVPVNPTRFRRGVNMSTGMMITAAAGPLSNVVLAIAEHGGVRPGRPVRARSRPGAALGLARC